MMILPSLYLLIMYCIVYFTLKTEFYHAKELQLEKNNPIAGIVLCYHDVTPQADQQSQETPLEGLLHWLWRTVSDVMVVFAPPVDHCPE